MTTKPAHELTVGDRLPQGQIVGMAWTYDPDRAGPPPAGGLVIVDLDGTTESLEFAPTQTVALAGASE